MTELTPPGKACKNCEALELVRLALIEFAKQPHSYMAWVERQEKFGVKRFPGERQGRCAAVATGGLVYAVATDPNCAEGITAQTKNTLEELDRVLNEAGSGKPGLVQATVYLSDIASKPEMDAVWNEWVGPQENWPQRACVGVDLDAGYLIEVVVTAKLL